MSMTREKRNGLVYCYYAPARIRQLSGTHAERMGRSDGGAMSRRHACKQRYQFGMTTVVVVVVVVDGSTRHLLTYHVLVVAASCCRMNEGLMTGEAGCRCKWVVADARCHHRFSVASWDFPTLLFFFFFLPPCGRA